MEGGPKGYIHGWICVRPPCGTAGDRITHPEHGNGVITGKDPAGNLKGTLNGRPVTLGQPKGNASGATSALISATDRRKAAQSMSDADLLAADREFDRRAALLGKAGMLGEPHKAVKDELANRGGSHKRPEPGAPKSPTTGPQAVTPAVKARVNALLDKFTPKRFRENKDAAAYLDKVKPKLTADQESALSYYTGDGFYRLNAALRDGDTARDPELVKLLDSAMRPTRDDLVVTRRVDSNAFGLTDKTVASIADLKGKKITDPAYMSASPGAPYGGALGGITMHLAVPKGTPALPASAFSRNPHETELLLGRGLSMVVSRAERNPKTFGWDVWAVVVPEES